MASTSTSARVSLLRDHTEWCFVCPGSCGGVTNTPWSCANDTCGRHGMPLVRTPAIYRCPDAKCASTSTKPGPCTEASCPRRSQSPGWPRPSGVFVPPATKPAGCRCADANAENAAGTNASPERAQTLAAKAKQGLTSGLESARRLFGGGGKVAADAAAKYATRQGDDVGAGDLAGVAVGANTYTGAPREGLALCAPCSGTLRGQFSILNPPEEARSYSSVYGDDATGTGHARSMLNSPQAWSAANGPPGSMVGEHATMDLGRTRTLTGVVIQSRKDSDQYASGYQVLASEDGRRFFPIPGPNRSSGTDGGGGFDGCGHTNDAVVGMFPSAVEARYVAACLACFYNAAQKIDLRCVLRPSKHLSKGAGCTTRHGSRTSKCKPPLHAWPICQVCAGRGNTVQRPRLPPLRRPYPSRRRCCQRCG